MIIKNAEFITSVAKASEFLQSEKPIIAVAGKSNVGKSSFINMLAGKNKLARTSNSPGRTRLVNYFDFGDFILADLPGYGFAQVSKTEKEKWAKLMEAYFAHTEIAHVFSLVDIRHKPTADDMTMVGFLYRFMHPFTLIATKADKLGKSKIKPRISELAAFIKVAPSSFIATSSEDKRGREEVLSVIEKVISLHKDTEDLVETEED